MILSLLNFMLKLQAALSKDSSTTLKIRDVDSSAGLGDMNDERNIQFSFLQGDKQAFSKSVIL